MFGWRGKLQLAPGVSSGLPGGGAEYGGEQKEKILLCRWDGREKTAPAHATALGQRSAPSWRFLK